MLNYHQMTTLATDRQATYRAEAEQRRLVEQVTAGQLHPARVWLGRQLIVWGQQLAQRRATVTLPLTTKVVTR